MVGNGVLWVLSHLVLSLAVLIAFVVCSYLHIDQATNILGTALPIIVGYWFGAMVNRNIPTNKGD